MTSLISNWEITAKKDFDDPVFSDWIQATKAYSQFVVSKNRNFHLNFSLSGIL